MLRHGCDATACTIRKEAEEGDYEECMAGTRCAVVAIRYSEERGRGAMGAVVRRCGVRRCGINSPMLEVVLPVGAGGNALV